MRDGCLAREGIHGFRCVAACLALACSILGLTVVSSCADAPNERALVELWRQHKATPTDHEALVLKCRGFRQQNEADPLVVVSDSLAAWHLLQLGREDEAAALVKPHAATGGSPLNSGAARLAKAWLTRLDREKVKQALQFYYRRKIRYPLSLRVLAEYKSLPETLTPSPEDRWGNSWQYSLVGMKSIPGLQDQKYSLASRKLMESDFAKALAVPYGDRIHIQILRLLPGTSDGEVLELARTAPPDLSQPGGPDKGQAGASVALGVGFSFEEIFLAYVGKNIVLVCDDMHWGLLPKVVGR